MEKKITEEIARQSEISGIPSEDIEKRVQELVDGGKSPEGALAIWKSETPQLRLGPVKDILFRVVNISDEIPTKWKDGSEHTAVYIDVLLLDRDEVEYRSMALNDDNTRLATGIVTGGAYACKARVLSNSNRVSFQDTNILDSKENIPSFADMATAVAIEDVDDIEKYSEQNMFFKVNVGKKIETPFGGGIEVSSLASPPFTCWLSDGISAPNEGDKVIVFGYVNPKGAVNVKSIIA